MPPALADPLPLRGSQVRSLAAAAARELARGRRAVSVEVAAWRRLAERVPSDALRADALTVLTRKRGNTDGAALFWTLSRGDHDLLRLLVAHEIIWDFLDCVHERTPADRRNGWQLHRALADSLDPGRPLADYYRFHPWREDGGYLRSLVVACREGVRRLPCYLAVRPLVVREAERGCVQAINHDPAGARRTAALERWAAAEWPVRCSTTTFELGAAASAPLAVYALLALAAGPTPPCEDIDATYAAYFPWVSLATVMLDSYVDLAEDAAAGTGSYLAHYRTRSEAIERLCEVLSRAAEAVLGLRGGERHAVVVACMAAMYLSKDSARAPEMRATTREIIAAGGSLTRVLVPILRLWRVWHGQQAA